MQIIVLFSKVRLAAFENFPRGNDKAALSFISLVCVFDKAKNINMINFAKFSIGYPTEAQLNEKVLEKYLG